MIDSIHAGPLIVTNISFDEYLDTYAHDFYEWVGGMVIKMAPIHERHDEITRYLVVVLSVYLQLRPVGKLRIAPFAMRLLKTEAAREPDLMVIRHDSPHEYTPTLMRGPADVCIEVVSLESRERDYVYKRREYEREGVGEYWLIDPFQRQAIFYNLTADGNFNEQTIASDFHRCK